jgi:hypothetical protein
MAILFNVFIKLEIKREAKASDRSKPAFAGRQAV